jgi:hypothetical protein
MSCDRVDRWLDQGGDEADAVAAQAHAASCARCAAALAAALEIDALLAADFGPAPEAITEQVMARVAIARRAQWRFDPPAFDWWVRAAAQPSVALALALAALLMWRGDLVLALASQGLIWLATQLASASAAAPVSFAPATRTALRLVLLIATPWASWLLYRWSEDFARPHRAARRALEPGAAGGARVS